VSYAGEASEKVKWVFVQNVPYFCPFLIKIGRPRQMQLILRKFVSGRGESNRHFLNHFLRTRQIYLADLDEMMYRLHTENFICLAFIMYR